MPKGFLLTSCLFALAAPLCMPPSFARAEDDDLSLMRETASFTDVIDAFDDEDVFDLNITLGYERSWEFGRIQREAAIADSSTSGSWRDVANFSREVNELVMGLDVGIFRDLALYSRIPLVLSDDRSLTRVGGADPAALLSDRSSTPAPLFAVPEGGFRSPTRSGVDWISAGIAWSVLNQQRDRNVPTWLWMLEGRFNVSEPMHACSASDRCLTGSTSEPNGDGPLLRGGNAGIGRGVNALRIETRGSYRYRVIEPYAGFSFQVAWPGNAQSYFTPGGNLSGYVHRLPPLEGGLTIGSAIIPWEDRAHWQRFVIDLRGTCDFYSPGRDYTPLFDALGGSDNSYLSQPNLEGTSPGTPGSSALARVHWNGLLDVDSRTRLGAQLGLEVQPARYVRFRVNATVFHTPSYLLTHADPCNASVGVDGDDPRRGACAVGIVDPHYRAVIDAPGQRFRALESTRVDVSAYVTAQF